MMVIFLLFSCPSISSITLMDNGNMKGQITLTSMFVAFIMKDVVGPFVTHVILQLPGRIESISWVSRAWVSGVLFFSLLSFIDYKFDFFFSAD